MALLITVVALSLIDLYFTQREIQRNAWFKEANCIAALLMGGSPLLLGLFKGLLTTGGTAILFALRHRRLVERVCWALLAVYLGVHLHWGLYYSALRGMDPDVHFDRSGDVWTGPPTAPPTWMVPKKQDRFHIAGVRGQPSTGSREPWESTSFERDR